MPEALAGEWSVIVRPDSRVLEVVYPARPAPGAIDRYEERLRESISSYGGAAFDALVDQRAMPVLSSELSDRVVTMKLWAKGQGLRHLVRVVRRSAIAELQARKVLRDAGFEDEGKVLFFTPEDAYAQLRALEELSAGAAP